MILHVQLQQRIGAYVPIKRQGHEVTLAIGVFNVSVNILVGYVGAQTKLLLTAKPAANISGQIPAAPVVR